MKKALLTALLIPLSAPAVAGEWSHASAPMGQYEGGIRMDDDAYGISYGCSGSYSSVQFYAKGVHVAAGESTLEVDGTEVLSGNTAYNSQPDRTTVEVSVNNPGNDAAVEKSNRVLSALASGLEAVWTTPGGEVFTFPLKDSADIRACLFE